MNVPIAIPERFHSGDTVTWTKKLSDYLPTDGWVLIYEIAGANTAKTITGTDNGDGTHLMMLSAALNDISAGAYAWQAYATKGTERYTIGSGTVNVLANLAYGGATDVRSHAKITLDAIEATIENRATIDQRRMQIAGRLIERMPIEELIRLRSTYKNEYARELRAQRIANGLGSGRRILTRMKA
jgi:hypothetical protein